MAAMKSPHKRFLFMFLPRFAAFFIIGAALSLPARAYYKAPLPEESFGIIKVTVKRWYSTGSGLFRTSFLMSPDADILEGSTLDFRKMDAALNLLSVEVQPLKGFSIEGEYGDNRFSGGTGFDHDWLHAPHYIICFDNGVTWTEPSHRDFSLSRSKLAGTTKLSSVNAYLRVYTSSRRKLLTPDSDPEHNVDFYAGYGWYEDDIRISDGNQLLAADLVILTPPEGPFPGLNSTYRMRWRGARVGLRERTRLSKIFTMEGKFGFSPFMAYSGEGYWNLRDDFANPSFVHFAKGSVAEFSASMEWIPLKRLQVFAGYMGVFYNAKDGVDRTFFSDGTQSEITLENAKSSRKGWFFSLSLKY